MQRPRNVFRGIRRFHVLQLSEEGKSNWRCLSLTRCACGRGNRARSRLALRSSWGTFGHAETALGREYRVKENSRTQSNLPEPSVNKTMTKANYDLLSVASNMHVHARAGSGLRNAFCYQVIFARATPFLSALYERELFDPLRIFYCWQLRQHLECRSMLSEWSYDFLGSKRRTQKWNTPVRQFAFAFPERIKAKQIDAIHVMHAYVSMPLGPCPKPGGRGMKFSDGPSLLHQHHPVPFNFKKRTFFQQKRQLTLIVRWRCPDIVREHSVLAVRDWSPPLVHVV